MIQTTLSEVNLNNRQSTLQQKTKPKKQILPLVTMYHPSVRNPKNILMLNQDLIKNQPLLNSNFRPVIILYSLEKWCLIISQAHEIQMGEGATMDFNQGFQKGYSKGVLKEDPKGTLQMGSGNDIQKRPRKEVLKKNPKVGQEIQKRASERGSTMGRKCFTFYKTTRKWTAAFGPAETSLVLFLFH